MQINKNLELKSTELKRFINADEFEFETTEEVTPLEGIIGQERAVKAIKFGLQIKRPGYNIFMSGLTGTGKSNFIKSVLNELAITEKNPDDLCYLFNFRKLSQPIYVSLPCGQGSLLSKEMDEFIEEMQAALLRVFNSDEFEEEKKKYVNQYHSYRQALIQELSEYAQQNGLVIKSEGNGFVTIPLIDGKQMNAEEYNSLTPEKKKDLEEKTQLVQQKAINVLRQVQIKEKSIKEEIKKLQNETALFAIGHLLKELRDKYVYCEKLVNHLDNVEKDILENISNILNLSEENTENSAKKNDIEKILKKYRVNVLVDNSECKGAPVIFEFNPSYDNLVGRIEYENQMGVVTTDFTKIKAGALHKANGGYLVLQAKDVLTSKYAWEALKRTLKTGELYIENLKEFGAVAISTLKPEPVKINVKVILVGNPLIYHVLYEKDEDFRKFFKIKADFDNEMSLNKIHMEKMTAFISSQCREYNLKNFDRTGVAKVIEYSTRLAGNQNKLTTRFNDLIEVLFEADAYAQMSDSEYVCREHVEEAVREKWQRSNLFEEKLQKMIEDGKILISTEGWIIGQVNGLAVLGVGDYTFGKPVRITASTYMGRNGVINIEREIRMSGSIHDKGLLILTGFLGEKFAQDKPLALSASLCFEQLYGGIDGDSASSTELYCLLSSLADVPINQGIAVTGSVNQKGEIQPVGGVTEKIEGFFEVCRTKGLTGDQGVIIPSQNVTDLVLKDEVIEAVEQGKFKIYAIETIEQGIEIITGIQAGKKDELEQYPAETVYYRVSQKLEQYSNSLKENVFGTVLTMD